MGLLKRALRPMRRAPGVPQARHLAEQAVAPYLRADVSSLHDTLLELVGRVESLERSNHETIHRTGQMADTIGELESRQPAVLNAISSVNGTSRLLRRELDGLRDLLESRFTGPGAELELLSARADELAATTEAIGQRMAATEIRVDRAELLAGEVDASIRADYTPHVDTLGWLLTRVETIRAEMMYELRYGKSSGSEIEVEIVEPEALKPADGDLRLNLGCGHLPLPGYANVDMRRLPGVDVVAAVDALPVDPGTVAEIFSAHTLEHFPEEELRRKLLPYWFALLRPGGAFRAVVPDLEAMLAAYSRGDIDFSQLRNVAYGGQEYEGDFHFNGFTPASMTALLEQTGFDRVEVIAAGRANGESLELEVVAHRPLG
jgi:hypothetical protein